jgi:predicted Zn-dependent protease
MSKIALFLILFSFSIVFSQDPKYDFAKSYLENGQYEDAARLFKELYDSNPNKIEYFYGLIDSYRNLGKNAELIPLIDKQLKKQYHFVLDVLLGEMYYKTGERDIAIKHWQKVVEKDKENIQTYAAVSEALTSAREFKEAINILKIAKNKFNHPEVNDRLIKLYITDGNYKDGSSLVIENLQKSNDLVKSQGHLYAFMSSNESTKYLKDYLLNLSDKNPTDIYIQELIAWFFRTTNDLASAMKIYVRLDDLKNVGGREILNFAELSRKDGHYKEALAAFEILIDDVKYNRYKRNAVYGYALTLESKLNENIEVSSRQANEIINRYQEIIKLNATSNEAADAMFRIAMIKKNWLKDYKSSNKDLEILIEKFTRSPIAADAGLRLGLNYLEMGELNNAIQKLQDVNNYYIVNNPNLRSEVKYYLAKTTYFAGNIDSAEILFNSLKNDEKDDIANDALEKLMLISENEENPLSIKEYAAVEYLVFKDKKIEAIKELKDIMKRYPESKLAQRSTIKMATIYMELKEFNDVIPILEDFRFKFATSIFTDECLILLADAYYYTGNTEKAIEKLTEFLIDYNKSIHVQEVREKIRKYRGEL